MFKSFISYARAWCICIIAIHITTLSSCDLPTTTPNTSGSPSTFAGLTNVGNSCYMNAVLQVIAALYADKLPNGPFKGWIDTINTTTEVLSASAMDQLIASLPTAARDMVMEKDINNNQVRKYTQEDPEEFMIQLNQEIPFLDCIQGTTYRIITKNPSSQTLWRNKGIQDQTFIWRIGFQGQPPYSLDAMIQSDSEALEDFSSPITPSDYSSQLRDMSKFLRKNQANIAPIIGTPPKCIRQVIYQRMHTRLCIQLKRYVDADNKITDAVKGTFKITIHPDPNLSTTVAFHLNGCIVHEGNSLHSGHYTAYVKRKNKWYLANDSTITACTTDEAERASQQAYLLFYSQGV